MTTGTYGTLRHCLMAGMCSAAETTSTLGSTSDDDYASERDRLNQAKWRCPYSADTSAQYAKTNHRSNIYRRVTLHCERDWIEENS